jgi:hypothetical protein
MEVQLTLALTVLCCCADPAHQGIVAGENISCTACAGTLLLEFGLLSKLTGSDK